MQIRNINFAAAISTVGEELVYSMVQYGPKYSFLIVAFSGSYVNIRS
jgi:hypothetical protein